MIRTKVLSLLLLIVSLAVPPAFAAPRPGAAARKIDSGLARALNTGARTQQVIVTVKDGYRAQVRAALETHGDTVRSELPLIGGLAVRLHAADVAELASQPWIEAISLDADVYAGGVGRRSSRKAGTSTATVTTTAPMTTLRETLGLPKVATSSTLTGSSGIGVAIVDSGIAPTPDFTGRITGFYDFTRGGVSTIPYDDYGHGTHIAGLIGSSGAASNYEFQGIAPEVRLVGLKVLDGSGRGKTSDVINAIEYVIANKSRLNVQIVNLSLGHPIYAPAKDDPLVRVVEKASAAGLIVVASAGNFGRQTDGDSGYTGITSPGNAPSAITVGATDTSNTVVRSDDQMAPFSSRGPSWFDAFAKPNVVAPGSRLVADTSLTSYLYKLLPSGQVKAVTGQPLLALSGTSMAAGVTSGVVALILDAHNKAGYHRQHALTPNLVKAMLEFSSIPVANADYLTQGAGQINAAGAISLATAINTADPLGAYWVHTSVPGFTVLGGETDAWGKEVIFGGRVLTGDLLYVNSPVWTENIVWDANIVWDSSLATVLASNIVWGDAATWAANIVWADRVVGQMDGDNIVWGTADGDNIVWGTMDGDNIVWGTADGDNIVWGTWDGDNIVWGTSDGDNIVWGSSDGDNIVWGTSDGDNIVWGTRAGDTLVSGSTVPQGLF